jgi:hypothetical protein
MLDLEQERGLEVAAGMIGARAAAPPSQASGAKKEVPSVVPSWAKKRTELDMLDLEQERGLEAVCRGGIERDEIGRAKVVAAVPLRRE